MSLIPLSSIWEGPFSGPVVPSWGALDDVHDQMNRLTKMAQGLSSDLVNQSLTLEGASVKNDENGLQLKIDVRHYKPDEIEIKHCKEGCLCVTGKHIERQEETGGYVSRQFLRRFDLPDGVDSAKLNAKITDRGVLAITAPKLAIEGEKKETKIPIKQG